MCTEPQLDRRTRRRRIGLAVVGAVAITIGLLTVAATREGPPAVGGTGPVTVTRPGGTRVGEQAAAFDATTIAGEPFSVPSRKPTVLLFMTAWCKPIAEATALQRIERDHGDKVAILGVDVDPTEPLADLRSFADDVGARHGYVVDTDGALAQALGVRAVDSTVVLDPDGRIVYRDAAPTDEATLRDALVKAGLS